MTSLRSGTLMVRAKGPLAIFTRPELKTERVSYPVPTPSAVRGLLEAIIWKPAIRWRIERILVLNEIRFCSVKRNEVNNKTPVPTTTLINKGGNPPVYYADDSSNRAQRNTLALRDVDYQFEFFFEMTDNAGPADNVAKFEDMFRRRVEKGQCFHQPYFGCRECVAEVLPPLDNPIPISESRDLGIMLWDISFGTGKKAKNQAQWFKAELVSGIIKVPSTPIHIEEALL